MATRQKLTVNNKVFKYKDTYYQITQIASIKVVTVKKTNKILVTSLLPLFFVIPLIILCLFFGISADTQDMRILFFIGAIGLTIYGFLLKFKHYQDNKQDKYNITYGLSLRMSGGDSPIFMTPKKELVYEIRNGIVDAMNEVAGVNITMQDVNIDVRDSENVELITVNTN